MSVSIKPLEDRIVVRPLQAEQTTASGLVIPDTAKEKPQEGQVVAVGPGRVAENGNRVPVDVAEAIAFLLSDAAAGISGQTLRVCGQNLVGA